MMAEYDIFISFKNTDGNELTPDTEIARELYSALKQAGFHPFFSECTLAEKGVSLFKKTIDKALEQADTFILVLTDAKYADDESSRWVSYELDTFQIAGLSGSKPNARLFTLLTKDVRTQDLPCKLNRVQAFYYEDGIDKIVSYLKGGEAEAKEIQPVCEAPQEENGAFKYCKRCGKAAKKIAVFCSSCKCSWFFGSKKEYEDSKKIKYCAVCGAKNDVNDNFCCQCGNERFVNFYEEYCDIKQRESIREEKKKQRAAAGMKILNDCLLEFGSYPQEGKDDGAVIISQSDENGSFEGSDGELYAQAKDGKYYKVMPIVWRILAREKGRLLIIADRILDACRFHAANNNYAGSDVCAFLNGDFYARAFNDNQRGMICTTPVDNSISSTCDETNKFVCGTTNDKLFLLSRREASTLIGNNGERRRTVTAYAKANGAYSDEETGFGWWWLRSPSFHNASNARTVHDGGSICSHSVNFDNNGIVPALYLSLPSDTN